LAVSTLITATVFSTGCSVLFNKPPATDTEPPKIETPDTSAEEDKKVQEFMTGILWCFVWTECGEL